MMARQNASSLLAGVLVAAMVSIFALPETPLPSKARRESLSVAQGTEPKEPYPTNELEWVREGKQETVTFRFADQFANQDRAFSCTIDEEKAHVLALQEGLELCRADSNPVMPCYNYHNQKVPIVLKNVPAEDVSRKMKLHGLKRNGERWTLDYQGLVQQARLQLQGCIREVGKFSPVDQALAAFILSIPYRKVDDFDRASWRWTAGFLVPTSVMLLDGGDCDSKAALFCSLYPRQSRELVIFRSIKLDDPTEKGGHAMVGIVADESQSKYSRRRKVEERREDHIAAGRYDNHHLEFHGEEYIPVDAAGPYRLDYGQVEDEKAGDYEAITVLALTSHAVTPSIVPNPQ